jgi:hypothetical protein
MGEDSKKSFWTSVPGILTGIAAIIVAVGGIYAANESIPTPPVPSSEPSPQTEAVCGAQLPEVNLFGSWNWVGTNNGVTQAGLLTFKSGCTYTNVAKSGFTGNDEGVFIIDKTHSAIKLQNKVGKERTYLMSEISENSFHMSDLDNKVSLDFVRAS